MADFDLRLTLIQNNTRCQAVWSYTSPYSQELLGHPPYLFTYYIICLHHVTAAIFDYISEVKVRLRWPTSHPRLFTF